MAAQCIFCSADDQKQSKEADVRLICIMSSLFEIINDSQTMN